MKNIAICLALIAGTFAASTASFAQSNDPITRAQVRAELVQVEKAGYDPTGDQNNYPANIQAAEAKISAQNYQPSTMNVSTKVAKAGTSRSHGTSDTVLPNCVGPVDFCNVYFGG
jgi:hypothetical protein